MVDRLFFVYDRGLFQENRRISGEILAHLSEGLLSFFRDPLFSFFEKVVFTSENFLCEYPCFLTSFIYKFATLSIGREVDQKHTDISGIDTTDTRCLAYTSRANLI